MRPSPPRYEAVIPHLVLSDAQRAIRFYQRVFEATETYRLTSRGGRIAQAQLQAGDFRMIVSDELPQGGAKSPRSIGGCSVVLLAYTADVDGLARRFVSAGGTIVRPLQDQFFGERSGQFRDPEGYVWTLVERTEHVTPEEVVRRFALLR